MNSSSKVLMGVILGAWGVRGAVRFKSYAESIEALESYNTFEDQTGHRKFKITRVSSVKENKVTLFLEGITTRTQAEHLKGLSLFVDRAQLGMLSDDEFYYHDLEGLVARDEQNHTIGHVKAIVHYGGREALDIALLSDPASKLLIPFHKEFVKEINIKEKSMILDTAYVQSLLALEGSPK
ncbi:MAG: 16S rRNA processing protein RimM [Caedimonas sp.]|jgi:16S rRNA processing protein RimM|nr:16S rRNA processing protein RimM [Caedimonas sp.]